MRDRPNEIHGDVQRLVIDTIESKFARDSSVFVAEVVKYDSKTKEVTCRYPDGVERQVRLSGQGRRLAQFVQPKDAPSVPNESNRTDATDRVLIINAGYPSHTFDNTIAAPLETPAAPPISAAAAAAQIMVDELQGRSSVESRRSLDASLRARQDEERSVAGQLRGDSLE